MNDDYKNLLAHWDSAFCITDEDMAQMRAEPIPEESIAELAPSAKLFEAARSMKDCRNALDHGCGSGWAGVVMAKSGCPCVTCADAAPNAAKLAGLYAELFGVRDRVHPVCIDENWLAAQPDETYDGFFCSNVLDVVPPEMAEDIIRHAARVVTRDAKIVIGLNYWLSPERAAEKGMELTEDGRLYADGVLRLVSRTDEQWIEAFAPYFTVEKLDHFAWPGEQNETRRLFFLKKA